ncbi:MAG: hydroxyethylthiazole kinase [Methanocorpusculum sp.]|nr:hydroxyethylthiazole kinase [Methanocorpusculum sp.]
MNRYSPVLDAVRKDKPLVLQITNAVTVNDCANITICFGASPIMSDDPDDAAELAGKADSLLLNIGTANAKQIEIMRSAADSAEDSGIPIILDPVGAGASAFRRETAYRFMNDYPLSVIRGNAGEIHSLAGKDACVRGVESDEAADLSLCAALAQESGAVVAASGAVDLVTDGKSAVEIANGTPLMGKICGIGCMAGSAAACAAAVAPPFDAAVFSHCALGIAGEKASIYAKGPGMFKQALFDEVYSLTADNLERYAKILEVKV